jgi:hypothetical protein
MTSINGIPVIAPTAPPGRPAIVIAEVPIDLERDATIAEVKLRAPGIVRAASFWGKKPSVLGSASMRATEVQLMPLLFVECDPAGELQQRVFLFLPSNAPFAPREGYAMRYCTTAIGQAGAMHVYEIVEVKS